jgi:hypothetical protein
MKFLVTIDVEMRATTAATAANEVHDRVMLKRNPGADHHEVMVTMLNVVPKKEKSR